MFDKLKPHGRDFLPILSVENHLPLYFLGSALVAVFLAYIFDVDPRIATATFLVGFGTGTYEWFIRRRK